MLRFLFLSSLMLCAAKPVTAEIYKRVDAEGHVTYSSTPLKGSTRLYLEPITEKPAAPSASAAPTGSKLAIPYRPARVESTPNNFPRVDSSTQHGRDLTRQKILTDELNSEQHLLAAAQSKYQEAESHPDLNLGKQTEKISALQAQIRLHEKNIAALKTELANHRP